MPSDNDHIEESGGQPVIRFGERDNALLEGTRNGTPLDLAETENLTDALRWCEHAFNEDVLPPRARVEEPREFYAAANMGCLPRSREQAPRKQSPLPVERQLRFRMQLLEASRFRKLDAGQVKRS